MYYNGSVAICVIVLPAFGCSILEQRKLKASRFAELVLNFRIAGSRLKILCYI